MGSKQNPNWTQRESDEAFTLSWTMILIMSKSRTVPEENRILGCLAKSRTPANPNDSRWRRPCASDWSKIETKRLNSSFSDQDHEIIIIELQRTRTAKRQEKTHKDHLADRHTSISTLKKHWKSQQQGLQSVETGVSGE